MLQRQPDPSSWQEPPRSWEEVNAAYHELFAQIGGVNQRVASPTRSDWMAKLASDWMQVGAPGEKSEVELQRLRANLDAFKKQVGEEDAQARETWRVDVEAYQQERKALEGEKDA